MALIRRAHPEDAKGIHEAHMRSSQQVCSNDHTSEEIRAWRGRPYCEERRLNAIKNHFVWVVEEQEAIHGFGHFLIEEKNGIKRGHLMGLYLTPEIKGRGLGYEITQLMLREAEQNKLTSILLESTLTAHGFYKRIGFIDLGPQATVEIAGVDVRCFPMELKLNVKAD